MSYHVELPATLRTGDNGLSSYSIGTFGGGHGYGRMVQITVGDHYVSVTMDQLDVLIDALQQARGPAPLADYKSPEALAAAPSHDAIRIGIGLGEVAAAIRYHADNSGISSDMERNVEALATEVGGIAVAINNLGSEIAHFVLRKAE